MWYINTMEYYSATIRNETGLFVETWMDLESVIQSEISQKGKKQISYTNAYIWNLEKWHIDSVPGTVPIILSGSSHSVLRISMRKQRPSVVTSFA